MPTQNPKISAYVPQVVYDSFKQYEKKHGGSMSQALAQLIADCLGIDLSTFTVKSTGGLQSEIEDLRIEIHDLKNNLVDLKEIVANLVEKVEYISSTSSPRKNSKSSRVKVEVSSQQESESSLVEDKSLDVSSQELLKHQDNTSVSVNGFIEDNKKDVLLNQDVSKIQPVITEEIINENILVEGLNIKNLSVIQDNTNSKLQFELPVEQNDLCEQSEILNSPPTLIKSLDVNQEKVIELDNDNLEQQVKPIDDLGNKPLLHLETEHVGGELPSDISHENIDISTKPLKIVELASRFTLSSTMLVKASKYEITKQIEYTTSKDPENIPWVYSQLKKRFYALRKP
jgi:hypothetical protein